MNIISFLLLLSLPVFSLSQDCKKYFRKTKLENITQTKQVPVFDKWSRAITIGFVEDGSAKYMRIETYSFGNPFQKQIVLGPDIKIILNFTDGDSLVFEFDSPEEIIPMPSDKFRSTLQRVELTDEILAKLVESDLKSTKLIRPFGLVGKIPEFEQQALKKRTETLKLVASCFLEN